MESFGNLSRISLLENAKVRFELSLSFYHQPAPDISLAEAIFQYQIYIYNESTEFAFFNSAEEENLRKHLQSSFLALWQKDSDSPPLGSLEACSSSSSWHSSFHGKTRASKQLRELLYLPSLNLLSLSNFLEIYISLNIFSQLNQLKMPRKTQSMKTSNACYTKYIINMYFSLQPQHISVCSKILLRKLIQKSFSFLKEVLLFQVIFFEHSLSQLHNVNTFLKDSFFSMSLHNTLISYRHSYGKHLQEFMKTVSQRCRRTFRIHQLRTLGSREREQL